MFAHRVNVNIPLSHSTSVLSWDRQTIDSLVDKSIEVAAKVGLRLDDDKDGIFLAEAQAKGAKIDRDNNAVMFTRGQIEQAIEVMRSTSPAEIPLRPLSCNVKERQAMFDLGNGANLVFDWNNWNARPAKTADLVELCQWAQGNDEVDMLIQPVMLQDVDRLLEPIYSYAIMGKYYAGKVFHNQPTEPIHVRYFEQMAEVVHKHRSYRQPMPEFEYINPPFRMAKRAIETMLERVDSGACKAIGIGTMTVAGITSAVSVASQAVTAVAEILTGLAFFNILRPGLGLNTQLTTGAINMRDASVNFCSSRVHLGNLAAWELVVRGLGVNACVQASYRDANEPGLQASYEFGSNTAFFSSVLHPAWPEIGGLSCGNIFSPHQATIDMEILKEFNELCYGFDVSLDDKELGLQDVIDFRFSQEFYMTSEHTLGHVQECVPFSNFFMRGLTACARHDRNHNQTRELMDKAAQTVDACIEKGKQALADDYLGSELYGFVNAAAKELGIEAPPMV